MPQPLLSVREAIRAAVERISHDEVETAWTMAGPIPGDPDSAGGTVFTDQRTLFVHAAPEVVYRAVLHIGGGHGWYAAGEPKTHPSGARIPRQALRPS